MKKLASKHIAKGIVMAEQSTSDGATSTAAVVESLSDSDRSLVEHANLKKELARSNVKNALSQSENADLLYDNVILQLALKYKLTEGDVITEDGTIKRSKQ